MSLAQQTLKLNNLGRARRLLDRHRPQPGEEDLRGWEWRYLWQLTRSTAIATLVNRPVRGYDVSFSADGAHLAVGWYDGRVDLWDVPGRRLLRSLTPQARDHTGRVAFSPVGNLLAATSRPEVVALYDLDANRESILWRAPDQGGWHVRDLSFSPDGSRVVIYAGSEFGDAVWVVNVSSSVIEHRHPTVGSGTAHHGAARLSPDNRLLYVSRSDASSYRYGIQCVDLATDQERWQTEPQRDYGLSTLALSPDGQVLASGSGFEDPTIRVWDAATGRLRAQLEEHTVWVCKLTFTKDGRRLVSAAADQSIRFWDTATWKETQVLRGHTDEVHAVAISEPARLVASAGKDGNLMLWKDDGKTAAAGYRQLPQGLDDLLSLDHSRVLLLARGRAPEWVDLKQDAAPLPLPQIGPSANVLGPLGTNLLCHWDGSKQILVNEVRGVELIPRAAIPLRSATRPTGFAGSAARQTLAWSEGSPSAPVYYASLAAPDRPIELKTNIHGLHPFAFNEDGQYLASVTSAGMTLRVWDVPTGRVVASVSGPIHHAAFASGGRVLAVAVRRGNDHEMAFYDLAHPDKLPRLIPGRHDVNQLAVSHDGKMVAAATGGGLVRLFDPAGGEWIDDFHGHLNAVFGIAFSADDRRLVSTSSGGRETVKLWDVGTRQELLTLAGTGSIVSAGTWSADGDVILAGPPWQAWRAPSWEQIDAAEAKDAAADNPR